MSTYSEPAFFKEALIYQVYPSSFCDSNDDGFGDLHGIRSKLDYLESFGVDVLWLSPMYKSPLKDMGYDISDYKDIDPRYGTLDDWDMLAADIHSRGMRIIMDLVVNHTSDQHEWFIESRSSRTNPKRDWYIWKAPKYSRTGERLPPNNWAARFGGSAWEWDEMTQEYYLHLYVKEQPDLNWENPEVREAIWEMMLWWLKRGTDGFRMDVINMISKTPGLPDGNIVNPADKYQPAYEHYVNGPRVHEFIQEMNRRVLSHFPRCLTVGEAPSTYDPAEVIKFVKPERKELQMVFHFELNEIDRSPSKAFIPVPFTLRNLKDIVNKWQRYMFENGGWNALYLENHDIARSISRFLDINNSDDPLRARGAKLLSILQTTQSGTLFVFQGQELGMKNVPAEWDINEFKDVKTQNLYEEWFDRLKKEENSENPDMSQIMTGINKNARDNGRTPVQWSSAPHGGFTSPNATSWMRVNEDYKQWNAELQINDPRSVLSFWKMAIAVRKSHEVMTYGDFNLLSPEDNLIFSYVRKQGDALALIILNFSREEVMYTCNPGGTNVALHLVLSNVEECTEHTVQLDMIKVRMAPFEGRIYVA